MYQLNLPFRSKGNNAEIFCCANKEMIAQPLLSLALRVLSPGGIIDWIVRKTQYRILLRVRCKERLKAHRISISDIISDITPTTLRYHERNQQRIFFNSNR